VCVVKFHVSGSVSHKEAASFGKQLVFLSNLTGSDIVGGNRHTVSKKRKSFKFLIFSFWMLTRSTFTVKLFFENLEHFWSFCENNKA